MASLDDVLLALGRVQEGVEALQEAVAEDRRNARESRQIIHKRLDDQVEDIASLKTDVAIAAKVDAQVRDELKSLNETVENNYKAVAPHVEDWKRMKTLGLGLAGLLALGGLSVGAALTWAGDTLATAIRHWLRL